MSRRSQGTLRILLTEDHATTRIGIRQILEEELHTVSFGEAGNSRETLVAVARQDWDLVILDLGLPDRNGLDTLREIKRLRPGLSVLIFSVHPEDQFAAHALRAEAAGYLTKERAPEELANAVRTVIAGGRYFSPAVAERLRPGRTLLTGQAPHEALSAREFQVLRLTAAGKAGKTIAAELRLSQKTVSTYLGRALKKLGLSSTAELARYAERHHLV